jgi:hypothetical protein
MLLKCLDNYLNFFNFVFIKHLFATLRTYVTANGPNIEVVTLSVDRVWDIFLFHLAITENTLHGFFPLLLQVCFNISLFLEVFHPLEK